MLLFVSVINIDIIWVKVLNYKAKDILDFLLFPLTCVNIVDTIEVSIFFHVISGYQEAIGIDAQAE